jgi:hypothetical protein
MLHYNSYNVLWYVALQKLQHPMTYRATKFAVPCYKVGYNMFQTNVQIGSVFSTTIGSVFSTTIGSVFSTTVGSVFSTTIGSVFSTTIRKFYSVTETFLLFKQTEYSVKFFLQNLCFHYYCIQKKVGWSFEIGWLFQHFKLFVAVTRYVVCICVHNRNFKGFIYLRPISWEHAFRKHCPAYVANSPWVGQPIPTCFLTGVMLGAAISLLLQVI